MKPEIRFMTFCDYAMVSQENKLSIIGIFDELRVKQFPGGLPSAAIVAIVKGEPDTSYAMTIKGDKGNKNIFPLKEIYFTTGRRGFSNIIVELNNIGFPEEGEYIFSISYNGKPLRAISFYVRLKKEKTKYTN